MNETTKAKVREMHDATLAEVTRLARSGACTLLVLDELNAALTLEIDRPRGGVFAAG
jgi:ATP:corrinoid adenosyltransferase